MMSIIKNKIFALLSLMLIISACGGGGGGGGSDGGGGPAASNDATLSALVLSAGDIGPVFTSGTTSYTLTGSSVSTTVTATVNQPNATVTVNGAAVSSGTASTSIPLPVGDTTINIVVTAQDGSTTQTYTVTATTIALSSDASLSALVLSTGAIDPVFDSGTTNYTLAGSATSTTVTPTASESNATVTVNGVVLDSGSESAEIALAVGNTAINVVVTAEDGNSTQTYAITVSQFVSLELLDPFPASNDRFGEQVVQLANGNIVVSDSRDSSRFTNNGAVHLYSPFSSTPIASFFGNAGGDGFGSSGITALRNGNYVIASAADDEGGIVNSGSVRLVDGDTGEQIGTTLAGDLELDLFGVGGITALNNGNYVIASYFDNEGGVANAGSVRLVNGSTGVQIGAALVGDTQNDLLGRSGITGLSNGNYVIASEADDEGGIVDAGSVRLVNGITGVQIAAQVGDTASDSLGASSITALGNGNYVIASISDDVAGISNAGSVRLVDGISGVQVGNTLAGDDDNDRFGRGIAILSNGNYVIVSNQDDVAGITNAGSVRLVSGSSGEQIGATFAGDVSDDRLGSSGIVTLINGNYVIASANDDEGGITNAGSVRLVNGSTGEQVGATLAGDDPGDSLGVNGVIALSNGSYVIASSIDDVGGIANAGSVRLISGDTGEQVGAPLVGDATGDLLGSRGVTSLQNGNYVITSFSDQDSALTDEGSVRLVNGSTGEQIGTTLSGNDSDDDLGSGGITGLKNSIYVVVSPIDDEGGITNLGSVRSVNGNTGLVLGVAINGVFAGDMVGAQVLTPATGDYFILSQKNADNTGQVDAGRVRVVVP